MWKKVLFCYFLIIRHFYWFLITAVADDTRVSRSFVCKLSWALLRNWAYSKCFSLAFFSLVLQHRLLVSSDRKKTIFLQYPQGCIKEECIAYTGSEVSKRLTNVETAQACAEYCASSKGSLRARKVQFFRCASISWCQVVSQWVSESVMFFG